MKFLIDDKRDTTPTGDEPDVIARNFEAGALILSLLLEKDELYIDHDLGDPDPEKTGYVLIRLIEEQLGTAHSEMRSYPGVPHKIVCVSDNGPGRQRIEAAIRSIRRLEVKR